MFSAAPDILSPLLSDFRRTDEYSFVPVFQHFIRPSPSPLHSLLPQHHHSSSYPPRSLLGCSSIPASSPPLPLLLIPPCCPFPHPVTPLTVTRTALVVLPSHSLVQRQRLFLHTAWTGHWLPRRPAISLTRQFTASSPNLQHKKLSKWKVSSMFKF